MDTDKKCKVCGRDAYCRGLCGACYAYAYRHNIITVKQVRIKRDPEVFKIKLAQADEADTSDGGQEHGTEQTQAI